MKGFASEKGQLVQCPNTYQVGIVVGVRTPPGEMCQWVSVMWDPTKISGHQPAHKYRLVKETS
jgi:hypothetical protein